jgi:phage baseplate assembly protein W
MAEVYYQLPFRPGDLSQKREHARCSLKDSVSGVLHLIAVTRFGELRPDESYGCEVWDFDFENITNTQLFRERIQVSLKQAIERHEPRLMQVRIDVQVQQVEYRVINRRTKSRITLKVDGILKLTREPFSYAENFFIGPLSYY